LWGFGVDWIDQLVPFQASASVTLVPELSVELPTAVHVLADVHETPEKVLDASPAGVGVDWIDQLVPSQASAKVTLGPELSAALPTASQEVEEMHETAARIGPLAPAGFGVDSIDQLVPSQASASVTILPELLVLLPTATHAPDVQETPERTLSLPPPAGVTCIDQRVPFQLSARVAMLPEASV